MDFTNYLQSIRSSLLDGRHLNSRDWVEATALKSEKLTHFNIPTTYDRIFNVPIYFLKTLLPHANICRDLVDIFMLMIQERSYIRQLLNKRYNGMFFSSSFSAQIIRGVSSGEIRHDNGEIMNDIFARSVLVFPIAVETSIWMSLEIDVTSNKFLFVSARDTLGIDHQMYFKKYLEWLKNVAENCQPKVNFAETDWTYEVKFAKQLSENDVDSGAFMLFCADARGIGIDVDYDSITKDDVKDYKEFIAKVFQTGRLDFIPEMLPLKDGLNTLDSKYYLGIVENFSLTNSVIGSQSWVDTVLLRPQQSTRFNIPMTCRKSIEVPLIFLKTLLESAKICGELIDLFMVIVQERQFIGQALNKKVDGLFFNSSYSVQIASGVSSGEVRAESGERRVNIFTNSFLVFPIPIVNEQWMFLEIDLAEHSFLFVSVHKTLGTDHQMYFDKFLEWLKNVTVFCEPKVIFDAADWKFETRFVEQLGNDVDSGAFMLFCADARGIGIDVDYDSITKDDVKDYKEFIAKVFQTGRLDLRPEVLCELGDKRPRKKPRSSISADEILVNMKCGQA